MRILALFDDGGQSVKKALPDCDVVSVGITDKATVLKMDLTDIANIKTLKKMHKTKPFDLLMASPPCESWSFATASKGGNAYRFKDTLAIKTFEQWQENTYNNVRRNVERCDKKLPEMYFRYLKTATNGDLTAHFVVECISELQIPFVIENPKSSMIWDKLTRLGLEFVKNEATYCAYDNARSLKPTGFAMPFAIPLKTDRCATVIMKNEKGRNDGSERANIPELLIKDIVSYFR